jgi:hypothetical protein
LTGLLVGCASDGGGNASGEDGGVQCETDFPRLATAKRVSLRDDVMPIFGLSCTMSSCHGGEEPPAKLYLGVRCAYDETSPHRCTFPDAPGQSTNPEAMPLTPEVVDRVYPGLLASSRTAPTVPLVSSGDPSASFLVDKLRGTHNARGYDCVSFGSDETDGPCGRAMPLGSSSLCDLGSSGASQFNTIVAWVLQGARDD